MSSQRMLFILPRVRWFMFGMAAMTLVLCAATDDGLLFLPAILLLFVGGTTYPVESANRRVADVARSATVIHRAEEEQDGR